MSGKTVNSAILLLIIGNALAIVSDVFIKLMEPEAPVFQFAFLRNLITVLLLMPLLRWQFRRWPAPLTAALLLILLPAGASA